MNPPTHDATPMPTAAETSHAITPINDEAARASDSTPASEQHIVRSTRRIVGGARKDFKPILNLEDYIDESDNNSAAVLLDAESSNVKSRSGSKEVTPSTADKDSGNSGDGSQRTSITPYNDRSSNETKTSDTSTGIEEGLRKFIRAEIRRVIAE